jgi:tRNA pseudouridine55 synthase
MDKVLNLYKQAGETPLECILRFKKNNPEYENVPMTYAGRLDPLAEGVLLVLTGKEVHRKEEFLNLKKEYEVDVLFGVGTDTFDVLGIPLSSLRMRGSTSAPEFLDWSHEYFSAEKSLDPDSHRRAPSLKLGPIPISTRLRGNDNADAEKILKKFIGKNIFEYPAYSSKTVSGKPLFSLARSGELEDVEMPKREVEIFSLEIMSFREINSKDLLKDIENKINKVKGDFRQEIIISRWKEVLEKSDNIFQIVKIKAEVSSGTYMRTLAHEWGKALGVPALAYHIVRTRVDSYGLESSVIPAEVEFG